MQGFEKTLPSDGHKLSASLSGICKRTTGTKSYNMTNASLKYAKPNNRIACPQLLHKRIYQLRSLDQVCECECTPRPIGAIAAKRTVDKLVSRMCDVL